MGRTTKIVLIVAASLLALCLCSAIAGAGLYVIQGRSVARNVSVEVAADTVVSRDIAEYTVPDGYRQDFSVDAGGLSIAGLRSSSGNGHIYLLQTPGYLHINQAELERQLRESIRNHTLEDEMRLREVGTTQVTIRGEQVQMSVSEGTNSRGKVYRQVLGLYDGSDGTIMLLIAGPLDEWNQGAVDSFLASIR